VSNWCVFDTSERKKYEHFRNDNLLAWALTLAGEFIELIRIRNVLQARHKREYCMCVYPLTAIKAWCCQRCSCMHQHLSALSNLPIKYPPISRYMGVCIRWHVAMHDNRGLDFQCWNLSNNDVRSALGIFKERFKLLNENFHLLLNANAMSFLLNTKSKLKKWNYYSTFGRSYTYRIWYAYKISI